MIGLAACLSGLKPEDWTGVSASRLQSGVTYIFIYFPSPSKLRALIHGEIVLLLGFYFHFILSF